MTGASGPGGWLAYEVTETETGTVVARGEREVQPADIEVMRIAARPLPRLGRLRLGPRSFGADLVSWLATRCRARTTRRVELGQGFRLALLDQPGPDRLPGLPLVATRDGADTFCFEWFTIDADPSTATKLQESGTLRLDWAEDREGQLELVGTTFLTDVSLRLRPGRGGQSPDPVWRVRVLAGSTVRWPSAANGIHLVPRLRPDFSTDRPAH